MSRQVIAITALFCCAYAATHVPIPYLIMHVQWADTKPNWRNDGLAIGITSQAAITTASNIWLDSELTMKGRFLRLKKINGDDTVQHLEWHRANISKQLESDIAVLIYDSFRSASVFPKFTTFIGDSNVNLSLKCYSADIKAHQWKFQETQDIIDQLDIFPVQAVKIEPSKNTGAPVFIENEYTIIGLIADSNIHPDEHVSIINLSRKDVQDAIDKVIQKNMSFWIKRNNSVVEVSVTEVIYEKKEKEAKKATTITHTGTGVAISDRVVITIASNIYRYNKNNKREPKGGTVHLRTASSGDLILATNCYDTETATKLDASIALVICDPAAKPLQSLYTSVYPLEIGKKSQMFLCLYASEGTQTIQFESEIQSVDDTLISLNAVHHINITKEDVGAPVFSSKDKQRVVGLVSRHFRDGSLAVLNVSLEFVQQKIDWYGRKYETYKLPNGYRGPREPIGEESVYRVVWNSVGYTGLATAISDMYLVTAASNIFKNEEDPLEPAMSFTLVNQMHSLNVAVNLARRVNINSSLKKDLAIITWHAGILRPFGVSEICIANGGKPSDMYLITYNSMEQLQTIQNLKYRSSTDSNDFITVTLGNKIQNESQNTLAAGTPIFTQIEKRIVGIVTDDGKTTTSDECLLEFINLSNKSVHSKIVERMKNSIRSSLKSSSEVIKKSTSPVCKIEILEKGNPDKPLGVGVLVTDKRAVTLASNIWRDDESEETKHATELFIKHYKNSYKVKSIFRTLLHKELHSDLAVLLLEDKTPEIGWGFATSNYYFFDYILELHTSKIESSQLSLIQNHIYVYNYICRPDEILPAGTPVLIQNTVFGIIASQSETQTSIVNLALAEVKVSVRATQIETVEHIARTPLNKSRMQSAVNRHNPGVVTLESKLSDKRNNNSAPSESTTSPNPEILNKSEVVDLKKKHVINRSVEALNSNGPIEFPIGDVFNL